MKYTVAVSVRGSVYLTVEAENENEARRIADEEVSDMDFNALENIDWDVMNTW